LKNIIRHILLWILAGIFLVSFTGLRLLIHQCMACESTDIYLFSQVESCCIDSGSELNQENACQLPSTETTSCCTIPDSDTSCENCCKDGFVYLVNEYDVSLDRTQTRIEPVEFEAVSGFSDLLYGSRCPESAFIFPGDYTPPTQWVGKKFILYAHQLKTDHISFQA